MKYRNKPLVTAEGARFDSQAEHARWLELGLLAAAGQITELQRQVALPIVVNGVRVAVYRADFVYTRPDGRVTVEDIKGYRTPVYRLKKKLIEALYRTEITEVEA